MTIWRQRSQYSLACMFGSHFLRYQSQAAQSVVAMCMLRETDYLNADAQDQVRSACAFCFIQNFFIPYIFLKKRHLLFYVLMKTSFQIETLGLKHRHVDC
ncbi:uncharacterized protein LOC144817731 isoform X2 [Lissotriton helveticus]